MLHLLNCGRQAFLRYAREKRAFVYGAGRALSLCLDLYFREQEVAAIVDGAPRLWGTTVLHRGRAVPVIAPETFTAHVAAQGTEDALLMITSPIYAGEIVAALDDVPELDGLACFVMAVVRETMEPVSPFAFSEGAPRIPKKLHYIWMGGKPLPEAYERNIATWREYNPDFEIIRWDETNYDVHRHRYVAESYAHGAMSFASNFMRLDIVNEEGGIYLDTDVEVRQSFTPLLADRAFFGMAATDRVSNGCGFGAMAHQDIIEEMLAAFDAHPFLRADGRPEQRPCSSFLTPVLERYGFRMTNTYQNINGVALYPTEVFSPLRMFGFPDDVTERTLSVHRQDGTWKNERERRGMEQLRGLVERMESVESHRR